MLYCKIMPPNLLLLMTDQHRADALGFMGNPLVSTPNLDRLAQGGVVFDHAFTQCPVCMASRAAIHTGRYPRALKVPSMGLLPPEEITLAETLKRSGYRTGMFGKLHFTPQQYTLYELSRCAPILDAGVFLDAAGIGSPGNRAAVQDPCKRNYGFDEAVGVEDFLWGNYIDWLRERSPQLVANALGENLGGRDTADRYGVNPVGTRVFPSFTHDMYDSRIPADLHPSRFIAEKTIDFIRRNKGAPFYAHCSFVDPHQPFNAPIPFNRMHKVEDMPVPPALDLAACYPEGLPPGVREQIDRCAGFPPELWQWALANYIGMVENIDGCVGLLLDELDRLDLLANTIVVFIADHGEYVGDHRLLRKGSLLFDSLMRVPFFVSWPCLKPGRVEELVQEIDLYPTIMSLLGLPIHAGVQGRDLTGLIRGTGADGQARVFCELDDLANPIFHNKSYMPSQAIRTREWKLNYFPVARTGMLFDLVNDPGETVNRWSDPSCDGIRSELMMDLLDHHFESKDPLPRRLRGA